MYTIRIQNGDGMPFNVAADKDALFPLVSLLDTNEATTFKVFSAGARLMPENFGFGHFRGWVERFDYEKQIEV